MDDDEDCIECDGAKSIMGWPCPVCQSGEAAPALMVPRPEGPTRAKPEEKPEPPYAPAIDSKDEIGGRASRGRVRDQKPTPEPPHDTEDVTTETPVPSWMWGDA